MTLCVVTGAAGFVGSHLVERLLNDGHDVVGIDSFTDYYSKRIKVANLMDAKRNKKFRLVEGDLNRIKLAKDLRDADYVFHLAAQPGVRPSWGKTFRRYVMENVLATQQLLEACKDSSVKRVVYASSSSIYGDAESLPTPEDTFPRPVSPYGATKLAGEHLAAIYRKNFGTPTVVLRYFTVYGPRQRPDMAFNKFISTISAGKPVDVSGDGSQARDFTFVGDTVMATVLAIKGTVGRTYNVGTGRSVTLNEAISLIGDVMGRKVEVKRNRIALGDVVKTSADIKKIRTDLGYTPETTLADGIREQVAWQVRGRT